MIEVRTIIVKFIGWCTSISMSITNKLSHRWIINKHFIDDKMTLVMYIYNLLCYCYELCNQQQQQSYM